MRNGLSTTLYSGAAFSNGTSYRGLNFTPGFGKLFSVDFIADMVYIYLGDHISLYQVYIRKSGDIIITSEVSEVHVSYEVIIYTSQFHKQMKRDCHSFPQML